MFSTLTFPSVVAPSSGVHRLFVIDCSGSMASSIDELKTHLSNQIPVLCKPTDYLSVLWFKHIGECGVLQEHVQIQNSTALSELTSCIHYYLKASGGTCFGQVMAKAILLARKYQETCQLFFMTDGCENSTEVCPLTTTDGLFEKASHIFASIVLVEYGWYTDRERIAKLTELAQGTRVFDKDFAQLSCSVDQYLQNPLQPTVRRTIADPHKTFAVVYDQLRVFTSNSIKLPCSMTKAFVFHPQEEVNLSSFTEHDAYAFVWYLLFTQHDLHTQKVLMELKDTYLLRKFNTCFSTQDYEALIADVKDMYLNPQHRFKEGRGAGEYPTDAFTLLDLLALLQQDETALFYPYHPQFKYDRISAFVDSADAQEMREHDIDRAQGCRVELSYHQKRANVHIRCQVVGTKETGKKNTRYSTTFWRNYSIIKDGVRHVDSVAISCSRKVYDVLLTNGCLAHPIPSFKRGAVFVVDLTNLPVMNRQMVSKESLDVAKFLQLHQQRVELQARRKYLSSRLEEWRPSEEENDEKEEEGATQDDTEEDERSDDTDNDDENSEREQDEHPRQRKRHAYCGNASSLHADEYVCKELNVKVKRCSTLPAVNHVLLKKFHKFTTQSPKARKPLKLTFTEQMMYQTHQEFVAITDETKRIKAAEKALQEVKEQLFENQLFLESIKFVLLATSYWFANVYSGVKHDANKVYSTVTPKGLVEANIYITNVTVKL